MSASHLPVDASSSAMQTRSGLGLLVLIAAGFIGNYCRWSFFFDIDFLFGSIAVWIVVCFYGIRWGTFAALIAASCTYFLWHHPYSTITFTLEALFVGLLFHRRHQNILLLDGIFWLLIGMPLVWLFYFYCLHLDFVQAEIILLKQAVNGIFNALVASLMLTYLPIHRWIGRPRVLSTLSLQQTLLNLLVAFVFFPTLTLMVLDSRSVVPTIKANAQLELQAASTDVVAELQDWHQEHLQAINQLANLASRLNRLETSDRSALQASVELTQKLFPDIHNLYVTDPAGIAIAAAPQLTSTGASNIGTNLTQKPYFKDNHGITQSGLFTFLVRSDLGNPRLILAAPILPNQSQSGLVIAELDLIRLKTLVTSNGQDHNLQITLVDVQQSVVASTQADRSAMEVFDRQQTGEIQPIRDRTYHWFPTDGSRLVLVRWNESFFVQETLIDPQLPWTLIVEKSAKADVRAIEQRHIKNLSILMVLAAFALGFATLLSHQMVAPLHHLARVTTNLPRKVLGQESINWPNSLVTEIDLLVRNFQSMAASLTQMFWEIKQANENLEQRVQERTEQLLATNNALASEIDERQRTEDKLKAYTIRLEQSNRELEDFAFVASHDLQEPLRKIQAFGDRFKIKFSDTLTPEGKDYLERMQRAANRMQNLINDLLAFSRVTTKAQPFTPINLNKVVQDVLSDLEVHVQRLGGEVQVNELTTLEADPLQMQQLFQNLISNALKFHCPDQPPIIKIWSQSIEAPDHLETSDKSSTLCQICVQDNGIGFDEKYLDRIFTVFQRLHGRNEYEGTGVGLAICRKIVERHNGSITAISALDQGATFIVTLPIQQSQ